MKKRVAVALSAVAVLALAAGAYAYFSSTGNGTGSASVGSASPFTVGETGTPTGPALLPDAAIGTGNIQTHNYTVTNPSKGQQNLNKVVISVATSTGGAWSSQADASKPACTASDFSVGGQSVGSAWTDTSLAQDFAANASHSATVTVQMIDNGKNQDNCQGVTVPLYFSAS
jgi:allophanate hydrolase subunit 2